MTDPTTDPTGRFRRRITAASLVATAVLSAGSVLLQPEFGDSAGDRLANIDAAGVTADVSVACFVLAQLPFIAAVLGLGHLLRQRTPRLANIAPTVAVVGGFGHAVFGGAMLVAASMAGVPDSRAAYAEALERFESGPAMVFAAIGLLGTVLGILLLAAGLWRARLGQRWVPVALLGFVLVEFIGTAVTEWASPASAALYLAALGSLARTVLASPDGQWGLALRPRTVSPLVQTGV